jgi:hypothetical protein
MLMLSVKLHDLKLKTRPKQLIGFLPLVIALPAYGNYPICAEGDQGKKGIHPRDTITPMVLLRNFADEKALYTLDTLGGVTQKEPILLVSCRPRSSRKVYTSTATVVGGSL